MKALPAATTFHLEGLKNSFRGFIVKKYLALALVMLMAVSVLAACGPKEPVEEGPEQVYKTVYSGEVTTLNYLVTASTAEFGFAANFIDTLIEYDELGLIKPCLAKSWTVSPDGKVYTFTLREGVKWYDHEGKEVAEVVAQDWVDSLKYIFTPENESSTANIAYNVLVNGKAYYNGEVTDFGQVGVKAKDKYILEFTLNEPVPYFLSMLDYSVFMPANGAFLAEQGNKFGTENTRLLYNGAYILTTFEHQNKRVLSRNENYWDKGKVHIKELVFQYNADAATIATELYLDGEISSVGIPSTIIDEWMQDDELREIVRPNRPSSYSYFYCLNFDPKFASEYDPANWKVAVNNLNFRKSLFHGLNRLAAQVTAEPFFPENKLNFTITPKGFADVDGKDFTAFGNLANFASTESFNEKLAKEYRDKALAELEGKVTFPVKVVMPYNTGGSEWEQRVQVIKQQMENLLGTDYVIIEPLPHGATGFLDGTRRNGNYAFQECNWGPDYADPETYTDPFKRDGTYNFPEFTTEVDEDGRNKFDVYEELVLAAKAELTDMKKRFELFAEAEAYIIENAWVVPYGLGGGGYSSSKLNPFESPFSPFGVSGERFKGQKIHEKPMSSDDYARELADWEAKRKAAK